MKLVGEPMRGAMNFASVKPVPNWPSRAELAPPDPHIQSDGRDDASVEIVSEAYG